MGKRVNVLVVAQEHGGGGQDSFREQKNLDDEVAILHNFYMEECKYFVKKKEKPKTLDKSFHQREIRLILKWLNNRKSPLSWVFTDLVKCYVWRKEEEDVDGGENRNKAIKKCIELLDKQITVLKPRVVLALGDISTKALLEKYVSTNYDWDHNKEEDRFNKIKMELPKANTHSWLLPSYFPSGMTADLWVRENCRERIEDALHEVFTFK
jgi:uracil-DNA glycosylase